MAMVTYTPKLHLPQWAHGAPGVGDPISLDQINQAFLDIDTLTGAIDCTSGTRPSAPFGGMIIYETDTGKTLIRNSANSAWVAISGITIASSTSAVASPSPGQIVHETNTRLTYFRDASAGVWRLFGIQIVNATSDITSPTNGQMVWSFTGFGLYVYKSSTSTWTPLTHDQYFTSRLGTNTAISSASWTPVPFATADEGSGQGISTSDNITWTFNEPGIWSVQCTLISNSNVSFVGCLLQGTNNDPFNAANQRVFAMQSANVIQTVSAVTLSADIRVATAASRTVRCLAIGLAALSLVSSGPVRPRLSFRWSPL